MDASEKFDIVKIEACAGAGKTSTLCLIAEKQVVRSLYLAFNKVTADEAQEKFPSHVAACTTHSAAYAAFGRPMAHKLKRPVGRYVNVAGTGSEIAKFYHLEGIENVISPSAIGLFVKMTVAKFEQSADEKISENHLPYGEMKKVIAKAPELRGIVLSAARNLWRDRINLKSPVLSTHDTYLKLFQLSKPDLGYKLIYCDEFQDTNPCVMDIALHQAKLGAKLIVVGDGRQAIYQWRGSVNAMNIIQGHVEYLSQSFRYGQKTADIASLILDGALKITGNPEISDVVGRQVVDTTKPYTHIFRTNGALLTAAVAAIDEGKEVSIEIDTKDFVKLLQSAVALYQRNLKEVKHDKITPYLTWYDLLEDCEEDRELKRVAGMVQSGTAYRVIELLLSYVKSNDPQITFTTAHKSKGREWEQVVLADDFPSHYNKDGEFVGLPEAEQNLLYVAATRAKRVLEINSPIVELVEREEEKDMGEFDEEYEHEQAVHYGLNGGQQGHKALGIVIDQIAQKHGISLEEEV